METALIFDIQRFSLHDGPGIRTTVFFKGCNLRCLWCHNPESRRIVPELMFYASLCMGCGKCRAACDKAFTDACVRCGRCASVCPNGAREISGKTETAEEILRTCLRDRRFYETSGGGVTLSGGEPLLQWEAAAAILRGCREENVNTAVETAGNVPWDVVSAVLPFTDLFLFDIKGVSEALHVENTGVSNRTILDNARRLASSGAAVRFRMPYIPGFNASEAPAVAAFAKSLGCELELMPYHTIGVGKYASLGRPYPAESAVPPTAEEMRRVADELGATVSA